MPSEELETFNQAIVGKIIVKKVFVGSSFKDSENEGVKNLINTLQ
ncbi:hypothetical protein [Chryseobacterium lactis]|nr:hypothetical protein [Chryseobacterium lactis]